MTVQNDVKEALRVGAQCLIPGGDETAMLVIPHKKKVKLQTWRSEADLDDPSKKPVHESELLAKDVDWSRLDDLHGILHFAHFVQHPGKEPPPVEVMGISLRNTEVNLGLSEETIAFSADLYLDGDHVGYVKNTGQGGANSYYPTQAGSMKALRKAMDRAAESGCPFEPLDSIINVCILGGRSLKMLKEQFEAVDNYPSPEEA